MKKIAKKCLTCGYMDFLDDELDIMLCHLAFVNDGFSKPKEVEEDGICEFYELNEGVKADAKMGMW